MLCINCNKKERLKGRRYCRECYLARKRKLEKERYEKFGRYKYTITCEACNELFDNANSKKTKFCSQCWKERNEFISKYDSTNKYNLNEHKLIAEKLLNKKLSYNEVVHHLDHNTLNNNIENLVVMPRSAHVALHNYLYNEEFKLYKKHGENDYQKYFNHYELTIDFLKNKNYKVIFLKEGK